MTQASRFYSVETPCEKALRIWRTILVGVSRLRPEFGVIALVIVLDICFHKFGFFQFDKWQHCIRIVCKWGLGIAQASMILLAFWNCHLRAPKLSTTENDRPDKNPDYSANPVLYGHNLFIDIAISLAVLIILWYRLYTCRNYETVIYDGGGYFEVTAGLASIIGLILTYESIRELGQNITGFEDLAVRLIKLLGPIRKQMPNNEHTTYLKLLADDALCIVSYTPALGYFGLSEQLFSDLQEALTTSMVGRKRIICLGKTELEKWHHRFENAISRRTGKAITTTKDIPEANEKSRVILESFLPECIRHLTEQEMPGYYFFATMRRAIIVAPMHLPLLVQKEKWKSDASFQIGTQDLEMVGIETTNQHIIEELHRLFDLLWKSLDF